ncbi:MAG: lysine--tRNA ligase [Defluviitaleaceae bacterium]|nr:lysine--tRNA ligase [Defluviitaleaceae bacterium]
MTEDNNIVQTEENISTLLQIRRDKLAELQNSGNDPFKIVKYDTDTHSDVIHNDFDNMEGKAVKIAGRMMTRRIMGKASFCDILDEKGRIQVYVKGDDVGQEPYESFKKWDIGDICGVVGVVFRTQKGEISVKATEITLLSKSLQILPEKYHGLTDMELRYRHRYVDLIVNTDVRETFLKRSAIIRKTREFLDAQGYIEVETPILQTIPGGASARPFATHHNALDLPMSLRIALELPLKRLIVGGLERVYEIGRCFRNEGISTKHNPEFTMLELYQAYTDYHGMMELTENLIRKLAVEVTGSATVNYQGIEIDFSKPFERMTIVEAVRKYGNVDFDKITTLEKAQQLAKEHHIEYTKMHRKGDILNLFFDKYAEEQLVQPTFIIDYPIEISFLTKRKPDNPDYTERFELFIGGREYANAYSELNDPIDQRERFMHQESLRAAGDEEASQIDEDFLLALEYGMPPTGGLGIGMDRLIMLLTNSPSIRDVLFFPTMRPL